MASQTVPLGFLWCACTQLLGISWHILAELQPLYQCRAASVLSSQALLLAMTLPTLSLNGPYEGWILGWVSIK